MTAGFRFLVAACGFLLMLQAGGCTRATKPVSPMPARDIHAVLRDHDRELMAIPGVVGVYVGLLGDERTLALKVMVDRKTAEHGRRIPRTLEGHPVVVEETGVIRPLRDQ